MNRVPQQVVAGEWVSFPGGELEGKRPKALCLVCRAPNAQTRPTLCFQCYRAGLDRERALKAAGEFDTASVERFQSALPFEPVNQPRLGMLKAERSAARTAASITPAGQFADRRRQAQIAARHAMQRIAAGITAYTATPVDREREIAAAVHAAELQLPESWLPFVVSR